MTEPTDALLAEASKHAATCRGFEQEVSAELIERLRDRIALDQKRTIVERKTHDDAELESAQHIAALERRLAAPLPEGVHDVLHLLRNPHGHSNDEVRTTRLRAADLLESLARDNAEYRAANDRACEGIKAIAAERDEAQEQARQNAHDAEWLFYHMTGTSMGSDGFGIGYADEDGHTVIGPRAPTILEAVAAARAAEGKGLREPVREEVRDMLDFLALLATTCDDKRDIQLSGYDVHQIRNLIERLAAQLAEARAQIAEHEPSNAEWRRLTYEAQEQARQNAQDAERLLEWIDRDVTYFDVDHSQPTDAPNVPVLASVSKRIWYHATDDTAYPFSTVSKTELGPARAAGGEHG